MSTNMDRTAEDIEFDSKDAVKISPSVEANDSDVSQGAVTYFRPKGPKIFGVALPPYRSPLVQTLLNSLVHSLVVGMFNVLSALGKS